MAQILKGAPVAAAINEKTIKSVEFLRSEKNVIPTLAIVRVGEKPDDISYEKGAIKRCSSVGIDVKSVVLPSDVAQSEFEDVIAGLNLDSAVHGILILQPLPNHLDYEEIRNWVRTAKDVDGITDRSITGVFSNKDLGFAPCTAEACMAILDHYGIDPDYKRVVVIGRSMVVGRPLAAMLLNRNATVTVCHTHTPYMEYITRDADIVISATGAMESITTKHLIEAQTVIDVGINWNEEKNKFCGDVQFDDVERFLSAITPVPGGVGAVTTSILASHVARAAMEISTLNLW